MPTAQPESKLKGLADRVDHAVENGIDEFSLKRLMSEIEGFIGFDPGNAYDLLGRLYSYAHDEAKSRKMHLSSINYDPHNSSYYNNFGVSLARMAHFHDALEMFVKAHEMDKGSVGYLDDLIWTTVAIGNRKMHHEYSSKYENLTKKPHQSTKRVHVHLYPPAKVSEYMAKNKDLGPKITKTSEFIGEVFSLPSFVIAEHFTDPEDGSESIILYVRTRSVETDEEIEEIQDKEERLLDYRMENNLLDDRLSCDVEFIND